VPPVMPDEMPSAPGDLAANPGEPLMPFPSAGTTETPAQPGVAEGDADCDAQRPTALDPEELGFTPRRAVPWLSPVLLIGTAVRVLLSELFGAYLDKRELQNALPAQIDDERPVDGDEGELWVDYLADTGDGFNATYSMAYLLAQPVMTVDGHELPRGEVLVLGGDQVYPTASGQQYEDRFKGPFRAALPQEPVGGPAPRLYALPGNHDWYDGLTAFLRIFVRSHDGNVGGWQTRQSRSYFAVRLPHRWWLLGLDVQSGAYIDDPQLRYFKEVAKQMQPGDRVIICPPGPTWVEALEDRHAYDSLDYFIRTVIAPTGAQVKVMISGDLHHYARYSGPDRELITAGGGGAYLYPTHDLPKRIDVPLAKSLARKASPSRSYDLKAVYPSKARSRALSIGAFWRVPMRNPGFLVLIGLLQTLTMLAFANTVQNLTGSEQRLVTIPAALMIVLDVAGSVFLAMPHTSGQRTPKHWFFGLAHGVSVVGLAAVGTWLWLMWPFFHWIWPLPLAAAAVLYLPIATLVSGEVLALYLLIAARFGVNVNELFAGQGITDYKGYLKLHFARDGSLTIYPIGVDKTASRWRAAPDAPADASWFEPANPIRTHLIEPPVTIR
jgi:hypothetical protein